MNTRRNQIDFPFNVLAFGEFLEHLLRQFFGKCHTRIDTICDEMRIENLDFSVFSDLFFDQNFIRDCLRTPCQRDAVDSQPIDGSPRYRVILLLQELRVDLKELCVDQQDSS